MVFWFWQGALVKTRGQELDLMLAAERVITRASQDQPADRVLREELRALKQVPAEAAKRISRAAFSYYRWKAWLRQDRPLRQQVAQAVELADRFATDPASFEDADLLAKAVPRWVSQEMAPSVAWIRSLQQEPKLWLRARRGEGRGLARKLGQARCSDWLADAVQYFGPADLFHSPLFHAGAFEIQDLSSQAVGWVCAPKPHEIWWDACAGEGGKLLHLSDLMENQGLIWASDRAPWRLQRLKRRAGRARVFNYRAVIWDGNDKLPTRTRFDGVLVDAPCSGLGTWQRNPHARWTTSPRDVEELAQLQRQLLARAAKSLKPGGRLVYSVCTLTRSETYEVAKAVETSCPELEPLPSRNPLRPQEPPQPGLLLPGPPYDANGMFIAVWKRRGDG